MIYCLSTIGNVLSIKQFKFKEMKKLKLDFQHLGNAEILTRNQLKNIMGGYDVTKTGSGYDGCCVSDKDCGGNATYCNKSVTCTGCPSGTGCCTA